MSGTSVEQFVMSCRVAGLGLESAFLAHIMDTLRTDSLEMHYVRTEKNSALRLYAERFDFQDDVFKVRRELLDPANHVTFQVI